MPEEEKWHTDFESSNVEAFRYDEENYTLYVRFKSGATYAYRDVQHGYYVNMLAAASKGKFVHEVLKRERFPVERVS
jgi:hypothetical protein